MSKPCPSKVCNPQKGEGGGALTEYEAFYESNASPQVREALKELCLTNDILQKEMKIFLENIQRGLKRDTHPTSIVKCFPTYVQDLPDGTETGKFLALDLGGTNFRVLLIELGEGKCEMESKVFVIPQEVMVGSGAALFDHIAQCLSEFAAEQGVSDANLPLGFTFSFPLTQRGLCVGLLERWTKGFKCDDILGMDVVQLLQEAIQRRGDIHLDICAVLNDTTGTLMSCAWKNPTCRIGLIVGTGNNGCYVETQQNAEMFDEPDMGSGKVIINMEMGAFGDDGALDFIRTQVDKDVDERTLNPGRQLHEKMISGMYLGEMVRCYMLKFTEAGVMFGGQASDGLKEEHKFTCSFVSEIESEPMGTYTRTREILNEMGLSNATDQDCIDVRYICQCLTRRSAHLISAAMVVLLHKMDEPMVTIGVDGSVYKYHPHFRRLMVDKITELKDPKYKFDVMLSEDGSGRGAALVAAVAARKKRELEGA